MNRKLFHVVVVCITLVFGLCGCGREFSYPPVRVVFRESLLNSGRVMQVINNSERETIIAVVSGRDASTGNKYNEWTLKIEPGETKEVGVWQTLANFSTGDKYKVSCEGYWGTITGTVP